MIDQTHNHPAELVDLVRLTHGERVLIRPVLSQDLALMSAFFHNLSPGARCNRFMHPVSELSFELLQQLIQVDHTTHVALIAETLVDGGEIVIGEARYVRMAPPSSAEVSVSVAEAWQGKGLAKLMLTMLECRALATGIRRIIGETFATNSRMRSLARGVGFSEQPGRRDVVQLEKILASHNREGTRHRGGADRRLTPRRAGISHPVRQARGFFTDACR